MKKIITHILLLALLLACIPACGTAEQTTLRVVTTIFPLYDWARELARDMDGVELTLLLDSGVDLHSFQPTAQDIMKIATCDVFVYVGGESDDWVADALREAVNPNLRAINLLEALGDAAKAEETVEGMEAEEEEEEGDEVEYDEHIWLSLRNAAALVPAIAEALSSAAPDRADAFAANAAAYVERLRALDEAYAEAVAAAPLRTVLFADRFPFRYLADDYGLQYYAAFSGCSAETEASFETVVFLAGKVDELNLPAVLTIEGGDHRIAETVVAATQAKSAAVLTMDSLQGTTGKDAEEGITYLGVMEHNLEALKQALGVPVQ